MFSIDSIHQLAQPAMPVFADMVGAQIRYIHARPYQRSAIIETGVIIGWFHHANGLYLKVQPSKCALAKWIHEDDFLNYVQAVSR